MALPPESPPRFERYGVYGYSAALDAAGTVATPLLAGFAFTLLTLVVVSPHALRWPDPVLVLLVAAASAEIAAVQCAFWMRQYTLSPSEVRDQFPELDTDHGVADHALGEYRGLLTLKRIWARRFQACYHTGIVALLASVPILLVPRGHIHSVRLVAIGVAVIALALEICWIIAAGGAALRDRESTGRTLRVRLADLMIPQFAPVEAPRPPSDRDVEQTPDPPRPDAE
jgi:MFS family permease